MANSEDLEDLYWRHGQSIRGN